MTVIDQIESNFHGRDMRMKLYYRKHKACPECGCTHTSQTLHGIQYEPEIYDDNRADCSGCGWEGIVHQLVKEDNE